MVTMKMAYSSPSVLEKQIPKLSEAQQMIAVKQLARAYGNTTPNEIIPWLNTLESSNVRDTAIVSSLSSFRHSNTEQAFELSTYIDDYNQRRDQVQKTLLEWVSVDPQAAMNALYSSSLDENLKDGIARNISAQDPEVKDFLLPAK